MMDLEYLTIGQASEMLQISRESLYKYAQSGKIPAVKIGRHWRFDRKTIAAWMAQAGNTGAPDREKPAWKASGDPLSVLIVDDEVAIQKLLSVWIRQIGDQPSSAVSGSEALDQLSAREFDLMFLDLHMPGMNGADLISRISEASRPPIVIITGIPESPVMDDALEHSVLYVLAKPFEKRQIEDILNMVRNRPPT